MKHWGFALILALFTMATKSLAHETNIASAAHGLHRTLLEKSLHLVHVSREMVDLTGSLILVAGVAIAVINMALVLLNQTLGLSLPMILYKAQNNRATLGKVRLHLGEVTALGLEVLVVSDILETLTKLSTEDYTWDALGKISAVAALRTVLAYMLGREVKEIEEKLHLIAESHKPTHQSNGNTHTSHLHHD